LPLISRIFPGDLELLRNLKNTGKPSPWHRFRFLLIPAIEKDGKFTGQSWNWWRFSICGAVAQLGERFNKIFIRDVEVQTLSSPPKVILIKRGKYQ
jgi:hypothetical protein